MDKPRHQPHTYLFTVSVWREELGEGRSEWRGKVKNIASGEERYFRKWAGLARLLPTMMPSADERYGSM